MRLSDHSSICLLISILPFFPTELEEETSSLDINDQANQVYAKQQQYFSFCISSPQLSLYFNNLNKRKWPSLSENTIIWMFEILTLRLRVSCVRGWLCAARDCLDSSECIGAVLPSPILQSSQPLHTIKSSSQKMVGFFVSNAVQKCSFLNSKF